MKTLNGRLLGIYLVLVAPLIVLLVVVNIAGAKRIRIQMDQIDQAGLHAYAQQVGSDMKAIRENLSAFCTLDADVANMQYLTNETDQLFASMRVQRRMANDSLRFPLMEAEFLYSRYLHDGLTVLGDQNANRQTLARRVVRELWARLEQEEHGLQTLTWQTFTYEGKEYLLYLHTADDCFMGFLMAAEDLLQGMPRADETSDYVLALERVQNKAAGPQARQGAVLALEEIIPDTGYSLRLSVTRAEVWNYHYWLRDGILLLPFVLVAVFLLLFGFLRRRVMRPLHSTVQAMEQAATGDLEVRIKTEGMLRETAVIGDTFNRMLAQLSALQENIRRRTAEKERAQLRNLQLQINPHFLSNCLNTVYNASVNGDVQEVLELTTYLSRYFRYMTQVENDFVPLAEELRFTEDFLKIQQLRFGKQFAYLIQAPQFLQQVLIPPSTVKSMAENAVQYGRDAFGGVRLEIAAALSHTQGRPCAVIVIEDNGPGFDKVLLPQLRQGKAPSFGERLHVGISNVHQRLQLLYNGGARLELENRETGGARVRITLPLHYGKEEDI